MPGLLLDKSPLVTQRRHGLLHKACLKKAFEDLDKEVLRNQLLGHVRASQVNSK